MFRKFFENVSRDGKMGNTPQEYHVG